MSQTRQPLQFVRIANDIDVANLSGHNVDGKDAEHLALVIGGNAGLTVNLHEAADDVFGHEFFASTKEKTRYVIRTVDWVGHRGRLAPTVGVKHHVSGKKGEQPLHVAALGGLKKLPEQPLVLLRRGVEA